MGGTMYRALICVAVCLLAGCVRTVTADFELKSDSSTGVIVVSVTASGRIPGALIFYVRPIGDLAKLQTHSISVLDNRQLIDWPVPKSGAPVVQPPGRLAVLDMAPGQYEFYRWSGRVGGSLVESNVFSRRFEVRAGEVAYLGNLHLTTGNDRNWNMSTADRRDRDFRLLATKLPNVPQEKIVIRLLK